MKDERGYEVMSDSDLALLREACERNRRDAISRAAERDAEIRRNAEAWSSALVCAVTGKPIPHSHWGDGDHGPLAEYTFQGQMREGGEAFVIRCGYGSNHDGDIVLLGLSNEALDEMIRSGRARVIGEYM